jgi:predicted lipid-binding transport protein (Tim44 family)
MLHVFVQLRQIDQAKVEFFTNATMYDIPPTGGNNQTGSTPGNRTARDCSACKRNEMGCIVRNRCWSKFGGMLGWMGGALLGVLLLALALKAGWLAEIASKAMSLFSSSGHNTSGKKAARPSQRYIMYQTEAGELGSSPRHGPAAGKLVQVAVTCKQRYATSHLQPMP